MWHLKFTLSLLSNFILILCNPAPDPLCQVCIKTSVEGEGYREGAFSYKPESTMKKKDAPVVSVVMGSDSDLPIMQEAINILDAFGIPKELYLTSAHRAPGRTAAFAESAAKRGVRIIIAGAGAAAHLAGVIASQTPLPVIGVPIEAAFLGGLDALLSTVQMPGGIPVATMAIGKAGAKNAAL